MQNILPASEVQLLNENYLRSIKLVTNLIKHLLLF